VPALREGGDTGTPITISEPDGDAAAAFAQVAAWIDEHPPTKRRNAALKVN
jgi:hypothetical protein